MWESVLVLRVCQLTGTHRDSKARKHCRKWLKTIEELSRVGFAICLFLVTLRLVAENVVSMKIHWWSLMASIALQFEIQSGLVVKKMSSSALLRVEKETACDSAHDWVARINSLHWDTSRQLTGVDNMNQYIPGKLKLPARWCESFCIYLQCNVNTRLNGEQNQCAGTVDTNEKIRAPPPHTDPHPLKRSPHFDTFGTFLLCLLLNISYRCGNYYISWKVRAQCYQRQKLEINNRLG